MDIQEIKETDIWTLYEKGRNYHRLTGIYTDTDKNYRMYNGNQWGGAKLGDVEPVMKNFIKPIVKYKNGVLHDNDYGIVYSSMNFENKAFRKQGDKICDMLNKKAARIWEKDKLTFKGRRISKDAAINDEGIMYVTYDIDNQTPLNEIIKKNDIYYGNENDDDIQAQPYILIRKRMPVSNVIEMAEKEGLSEDKLTMIIGDNDTFEESGEASKQELDNMVTVVTKMYKKKGTVHFSMATRWVEIKKDKDTGLTYYPVAHFNWEEKEGSARGEGEVRQLIPNQIEVNKTEMRRILTVKYQAYPQKIVNKEKVSNPSALNQVGGNIYVKGGMSVDDVSKVVSTLPPAQMSPDVKQLQEDLIQVTRDLAGAGDIATGQVNPEDASGRAILAVQHASMSPMTEQKESYKNFIEDLAKIWLDMLIVYNPEGIKLEEEVTTPDGETTIQLVDVQQETLKQLQASVKVDITPKGAFDRYAQELSLENLLKAGYFNPQKVGELKRYAESLPDDAVMPKQTILDICEKIEEDQIKIMQSRMNAQIMQQRVNQFLMEDPQTQASQMNDYMQQSVMGQANNDNQA
ncbi:MAG: hypothetical protein IKL65_00260 [Bacilli bacterium]|nr:hypothetical protein [Bacilli bacterium]